MVPALASGDGAQGVQGFREAHLGDRFHQEVCKCDCLLESQEHCIPVQPCLHCLGAMGCWCAHEDRSIPSCHSGLLWTLSWNLWQCKDLVRQLLEIRFDFSGIWSSSQKTSSYCILEMKLVTFCTLLLIKKLTFCLLFVFAEGFVCYMPVIFSLRHLIFVITLIILIAGSC